MMPAPLMLVTRDRGVQAAMPFVRTEVYRAEDLASVTQFLRTTRLSDDLDTWPWVAVGPDITQTYTHRAGTPRPEPLLLYTDPTTVSWPGAMALGVRTAYRLPRDLCWLNHRLRIPCCCVHPAIPAL